MSELTFLPVRTARLTLRPLCRDDLNDLYEYLSNPQVVAYEPYKPMTLEETRKELEERIASPEMIAVTLNSNGKLIGNLYLGSREFDAMELGYVFNRSNWGQGYAQESCRSLISQVFQDGIHRIYAECDPENENSWKLLERLGFQREAHLKQNVYFWKDENGNPIWKDTYIYSLLHP
ncbi:MAG: GNAT family N-acetyltransferase [Oscillospiraceae bacterium]|nr:GNAT family N-acetyltransferase [Oscillospiraceae bacterium]